MPRVRLAAIALLVVVAGCTGFSGDTPTTDGSDAGPTTEVTTGPTTDSTTVLTTRPTRDGAVDGTEPHTAQGTSHIDTHLVVSTGVDVDNVTVTLGTGEAAETYPVSGSVELTREIHDRGHEVPVLVERGNETVFDQTVHGYESFELRVYENDTRVSTMVV